MPNAERAREALESPEVLDRLATVEHERWAHWQRYLHDQCEQRDDGSLVIPADLVRHWEEQIDTPYADLSAEEQRSDQEQVMKYLPVVIEAIGGTRDTQTA
ncbi:hypothetical protein [Propionimicrobium sp. PCR01-08-3]|uniref:hypothetical protein n=1 Tax=Propionimicrobium sp. PCR01-08-3 TaxID=3052086 RepID=UPI00255C7340|nr:hypothetical protein [Propionimicrobium sp. PCR01-08-3]WIY83933.1 hypothetical protein QQ658_06215 [Propionimicrobium sp. PCR01-08-3]